MGFLRRTNNITCNNHKLMACFIPHFLSTMIYLKIASTLRHKLKYANNHTTKPFQIATLLWVDDVVSCMEGKKNQEKATRFLSTTDSVNQDSVNYRFCLPRFCQLRFLSTLFCQLGFCQTQRSAGTSSTSFYHPVSLF